MRGSNALTGMKTANEDINGRNDLASTKSATESAFELN